MAAASCRNWTQGKFFPEEGSRNEEWRWRAAAAICEGCPVRKPCLEYVLRFERAGSLKVEHVNFLKSDWERTCTDSCSRNCKNMKHWRKRSKDVRLEQGAFTISFTPPQGVWGGTTPPQRHAKAVKHLVVKAGECILGPKCSGCRSIEEWAEILLGEREVA